MQVKIIHYSKLKKRLDNLIPLLSKEGIEYEIIDKYDPELITNKEFAKFDRSNIDKANISIFLKHINTLTSNNEKKYIVVVEDDIIFVKNFKKKLLSQIKKLPKDYGFLFFDQFMKSFSIKRNIFNFNNKIYPVNYFAEPNFDETSNKRTGKTRGLAGYVFNTEISELLKKEFEKQNNIKIPIDHWLNHFINKNSIKVFWSQPPLSYQGSKTGKFLSETSDA